MMVWLNSFENTVSKILIMDSAKPPLKRYKTWVALWYQHTFCDILSNFHIVRYYKIQFPFYPVPTLSLFCKAFHTGQRIIIRWKSYPRTQPHRIPHVRRPAGTIRISGLPKVQMQAISCSPEHANPPSLSPSFQDWQLPRCVLLTSYLSHCS